MTAKIHELALLIEREIPSGEEMDEMRPEIWLRWEKTDYTDADAAMQMFQDLLAQHFQAIALAAGEIRLICETEADHRSEVLRGYQEIREEQIKAGAKP